MTNAYKQSQPTHTLSLFENMKMSTLQSKFCLLNSIPNHHKWNWTPSVQTTVEVWNVIQQVLSWIYKKSLYKCNSMSSRSLRNTDITHASFLFGYFKQDTTTSIRRNIKKLTVPAKKHHRPAFNEKDLFDFLGISP